MPPKGYPFFVNMYLFNEILSAHLLPRCVIQVDSRGQVRIRSVVSFLRDNDNIGYCVENQLESLLNNMVIYTQSKTSIFYFTSPPFYVPSVPTKIDPT